MLPPFISITTLQRNLKAIFQSDTPYQVVLSNNAISGIVIPKEAAQHILDSGVLDQLKEELEELHDPETVKLVRESRKGRGKDSVLFDDFMTSNE